MTALSKMSPADPLVGKNQYPWPYGPFVLADSDGNRWKLSARDHFRTGRTAQLFCDTHAEIDGVLYAITGMQNLDADGTPIGEAHLHLILPPPENAANRRRVRRLALRMVRKALDGPYAQAAGIRAAAIAKLPYKEQMKIDEETRIALASEDELEEEITRLREWLRPGGDEDQLVAKLIAELGAIRVNGARKRRQIEEKAADLHARTQYRAEKKERSVFKLAPSAPRTCLRASSAAGGARWPLAQPALPWLLWSLTVTDSFPSGSSGGAAKRRAAGGAPRLGAHLAVRSARRAIRARGGSRDHRFRRLPGWSDLRAVLSSAVRPLADPPAVRDPVLVARPQFDLDVASLKLRMLAVALSLPVCRGLLVALGRLLVHSGRSTMAISGGAHTNIIPSGSRAGEPRQ